MGLLITSDSWLSQGITASCHSGCGYRCGEEGSQQGRDCSTDAADAGCFSHGL